MACKTISILTDFGTTDGFVGIIKGVILSINNGVKIIDLSNNVPPQDIQSGCWILSNSYRYFPDETIFLCVIDPNVGSNQRKIALKTEKYTFIAPDNGLLSGIIEKEKIIKAINLNNRDFWLKETSNTFHGRDIYAPIAAYLSIGKDISQFGSNISINSLIKLNLFNYKHVDKRITGKIIHIDTYGNLITNIPSSLITNKKVTIRINNHLITHSAKAYSELETETPLIISGSHGFIEIAINKSNAAKILDIKRNEPVYLDILEDFL